jgi:hypothetical protein
MGSMTVVFKARINKDECDDGLVALEFEGLRQVDLDVQPRIVDANGNHRPLNQAETDDLDECLEEWEKKQLVRTLAQFIVRKEKS